VWTATAVLSARDTLFDDRPAFVLLDADDLLVIVSHLVGFYLMLLPLYQFLNVLSNQSERSLVLYTATLR
jgi:hypothetical protein